MNDPEEKYRKRAERQKGLQSRMEEVFREDRARKAAKASRPVNPGATRFTTDYAVAWGRAQGWRLLERETYDFRTRRHRDLEGGVDALFDDRVSDGRIGVQGAGVGERAAHHTRFVEWGGPELARRRGLRVVYLEFVRGVKEPVKREDWA